MGWQNTTMTIPLSGTASEDIDLSDIDGNWRIAHTSKRITFFSPTSLSETVQLYVGTGVASYFVPLGDGFGNIVTMRSAEAQTQDGIVANAMRLTATTAVSTPRTWYINGVPEILLR